MWTTFAPVSVVNQACSGHGLHGFPVSCIQYPESGRELEFPSLPPAEVPRQVMVVGGGPAGLKGGGGGGGTADTG